MNGMTFNDIDWQTTCCGKYAEVRTDSGWVRLRQDGDGFLVTRFDADARPVGDPERMTADEAEAALTA